MFMNAKHLLVAGMAFLTVAACNKETGTDEPIFNGDKAYINVQIAYSDPETRGTADAGNPFYYGTADENSVSDAHFFFYDANGNFALSTSKTLAWTANGVDTPTTGNIEKVSGGVVVLEKLKNSGYPVYMSVLLNANGDMVGKLQNKSIAEAQAYIIGEIAQAGKTADKESQVDWKNFVMTSSSFVGDAAAGYFCAKLEPSNFKETEEEAKADGAVTAYVERLAAKVRLGLADNLQPTGKIGSFEVDGAAKDLYFNVTGWGLNATADSSYAFKNIDATWSLGDFNWNDAANFRSYWAKFPKYGDRNAFYPQNSANLKEAGRKTTLNYVSYNDLAVNVGSPAYCRENTNTKDVLAQTFAGAVTSVLVKANVQDVDGNAIDLVNYKGVLYTPDGYKNKVLADYAKDHSAMADAIYKKVADNKYETIVAADLEVVNIADGKVYLTVKAGDYFTQTAENVFGALPVADAATRLNGVDVTKSTTASFYNNGMMYYNIPIEHLRQGAKYTDTDFKTAGLEEALYGVVRNHYYVLTINKIENLGKAVYDPDEVIVPDDDDIKNYFVGAKVNILSWKVVRQGVDL